MYGTCNVLKRVNQFFFFRKTYVFKTGPLQAYNGDCFTFYLLLLPRFIALVIALTSFRLVIGIKLCVCGVPCTKGVFRPRQTRQLPRAVDLKGRLLSCQSY